MKIVFIAATLGAGGAERVMSLLANQFVLKENEVEFILLKKDIRFYSLDERIKVTVAEQKCNSSSLIKKILWIRNYLQKQKPTIVFAFRISIYCITLFSLLGTKIPVIASERIDPRFNSISEKILQRLLLLFANHLVVQTNEIKKYYPRFIQRKTTVIFNPVSDKVFNLVALPKEKRIISVGRLHLQKNQKMIIEAFARIVDDFPEWKLVIYGEGPQRETLELRIKNLELENKILLPGRNENIIEELNKSEIFAFSSDYEGMSNAVVEAFCVGLPIITTKVSGTVDFIRNGENGFLLDIGDINGMEKAMRTLMSREDLRKKMREKNIKDSDIFRIEPIFSQWENVVKKITN